MNENTRGGRSKVVILLVIALVVIVLVGGFLYCCVQARKATFLNNVTVAGVNVSGMTYEEGRQAVYEALAGDENGTGLQVIFPESTLEIPASVMNGGMSGVDRSLELAYAYGHGGTLSGGVDYIRSLFAPRDFAAVLDPDKDAIRSLIHEAVSEIVGGYQDYDVSVDLDAGEVQVTKGSSQVSIDEEALVASVFAAIDRGDYTPIVCSTEVGEVASVDLDALYRQVYVESRDATFDENFEVVPEVVGISFDVEEARRILDATRPGETAVIPLVLTEPEVTAETLGDALFRDVLGECVSYVTNNANRNNNINLACQFVNETVLMPGEVFSYNGTVGERTLERGFKMAGAYVNGQVVDEVGGGICQVSSTIYLAALRGDLEIVDRTNHMFIVTYLPMGMDATVNWGTTDFKFANNTDYPLKIMSKLEDGAVTVTILGTNVTGKYVEMTYEVLNTYPYSTIEQEDPSIAPGQSRVQTTGSTGYRIRTYRNVYDADGNLISSTEEATSTYVKRDRVVLVAPQDAENPTPPDDGGTTPPPDDGGTTPPDDGGGETPPPDDGGTTPPDDGGGETPPPDDGGDDGGIIIIGGEG